MIKIAICDDDKAIINTIRMLINKVNVENNDFEISEFTDGSEFLREYNSYGKFNIVFMDIEVGELNGVKIIEKIRQYDSDVIVIFITNYPYYVVKALRVGAFQYLTKPIKYDEFNMDFNRAIEVYKNNHFMYDFYVNGDIVVKRIKDIYAIEIRNKKMFLYLDKNVYEEDLRASLKEKESIFKAHYFIKCHKSYMVNMWKIKEINKEHIILKNGKSIPLSRNFRSEVLENFNIFISRHKV